MNGHKVNVLSSRQSHDTIDFLHNQTYEKECWSVADSDSISFRPAKHAVKSFRWTRTWLGRCNGSDVGFLHLTRLLFPIDILSAIFAFFLLFNPTFFIYVNTYISLSNEKLTGDCEKCGVRWLLLIPNKYAYLEENTPEHACLWSRPRRESQMMRLAGRREILLSIGIFRYINKIELS